MKRNPQVWNVANGITALRMAGTLGLLIPRPLSPAFFVLYTLTGVTDVLDGWTARRMKIASQWGARLDSIADLMFYGVTMLRLLPILWELLPPELWAAVGGVLLLRLSSYTLAAVKYRRFASLHTYLNKLSGAAVFAIPYGLLLPAGVPFCWAVWGTTAAASAEELLIHLREKTYCSDRKSILKRVR